MSCLYEDARQALDLVFKRRFRRCCPKRAEQIRNWVSQADFVVSTPNSRAEASGTAAAFILDAPIHDGDGTHSLLRPSLQELLVEGAPAYEGRSFEPAVQFAANVVNLAALQFVHDAWEFRNRALLISDGPGNLERAARDLNQDDSPFLNWLETSAKLLDRVEVIYNLITQYLACIAPIHELFHCLQPNRTRFQLLWVLKDRWNSLRALHRPANERLNIDLDLLQAIKDVKGYTKKFSIKYQGLVTCQEGWGAVYTEALRHATVGLEWARECKAITQELERTGNGSVAGPINAAISRCQFRDEVIT